MANILRRADIIRVLTEAGVHFDPDATIVQLRPLYDEIMGRNAQGAAGNVFVDANNGNDEPEVNRVPEVNQNVQQSPDEVEVDRQIALLQKKCELLCVEEMLNGFFVVRRDGA